MTLAFICNWEDVDKTKLLPNNGISSIRICRKQVWFYWAHWVIWLGRIALENGNSNIRYAERIGAALEGILGHKTSESDARKMSCSKKGIGKSKKLEC